MLEGLISVTGTGEFEDCGQLEIRSIQPRRDRLHLELGVTDRTGGGEKVWSVECSGVREFLFRESFADFLRWESEHPVLLPFVERSASLYFYSASSDSEAVTGALMESHRNLVGDWIPLERFVNSLPGGLSALLASSCGLLAVGPRSLIDVYSAVLARRNIRWSVLPGLKPEASGSLRALILESSYVVAEGFSEERVT